jgi:GNAT superfamily N-acetyltransferase
VPGNVVVRPIHSTEVEAVSAAMPGLRNAPTNKHGERLKLQEAGKARYLIAWLAGEPVGHVLLYVRPVSEQGRRLRCAELEDMFVQENARGRGLGRALLAASESAARQAGADALGFGVTLANPHNAAARRLYERRGYRDSGLGEFVLGYTYWDEHGEPHRDEEPHRYFVKSLNMASRQL